MSNLRLCRIGRWESDKNAALSFEAVWPCDIRVFEFLKTYRVWDAPPQQIKT